MDKIETWFLDQAQTTTGSLLLFVLVFLTRISLDQWTRKKAHKRRKAPEKR